MVASSLAGWVCLSVPLSQQNFVSTITLYSCWRCGVADCVVSSQMVSCFWVLLRSTIQHTVLYNNWCQSAQTRCAPHCRMLPPGELNGMIRLFWQFTTTAATIFNGNKHRKKVKKGKGLDTCYSATYMSQTRDQQRFTISEVAADWHEPMVPQRIMWPSIARANGQLDPRCS